MLDPDPITRISVYFEYYKMNFFFKSTQAL